MRLLHARDDHGRRQPAAREPEPERGRDPARRSRATSAAAPATTTSSRPFEAAADPRRPRWRPPSTRPESAPPLREGGRAAHHRPGRATSTTYGPRDGLDRRRAQPARARAHRRGRRLEGARPPRASSRRSRGADLERGLGRRRCRCAWPVTDDIKIAAHCRSPRTRRATPATASPSSSPRAARSRRTPPSWSRSTGSRSRRSPTSRPRLPTAPRSSTRSSARTAATRGRSRAARTSTSVFAEADVTVKERYRQQRLIPNPMEPRGVLAQPHAGDRRDDDLLVDADPAHRTDDPGARLGVPEAKLRVVAPDVGGGFGSKLHVYPRRRSASPSRKRTRPPGQVDRGALGGLRSPPSTGATSNQEIELAATSDGTITAVRVAAHGRDGRVPR